MDKKKLRYAILKEIDTGNEEINEKDFGVTPKEFDNALEFLSREGYLKGVKGADGRKWCFAGFVKITEKGEQYLDDNSALKKTYNGLKEIRDWIK
ncbi:YjcQ family protein [Bhargavaea beijingensis]|uniref:YjcQ family protein n=1 Tax=Bhargavaea beijingensis TaxID=426756 RepID=UPI002225814E|nr:YjcQ family protein [Bhargavaea beijingensis]MCW1929564.1 YjcQ family protein [Bhargavaea beijingensis]